MKIATYSDLHLEFGVNLKLPKDLDADLIILSGDMTVKGRYDYLLDFLEGWDKPILYVMGNHEYYAPESSFDEINYEFKNWCVKNKPNITVLLDESINIDGVNFFGGTMWTDFNDDTLAMTSAQNCMSDYRLIKIEDGDKEPRILNPMDVLKMHIAYKEKLLAWFDEDLDGERVVISHHAPVNNPNTKYSASDIQYAFVSLDMVGIIEKHQPSLWYHGHTHENIDLMVGDTHVLSNQRGYGSKWGNDIECKDFREDGIVTEI